MSAPMPDLTRQRREELMARIPGGVAIFPSAPITTRNGDVSQEYRQNSDLYYLTGFEEPGSVAVLTPDHPEHRFVLFVSPKKREEEVWTGWRAGEEGAKRDYGADAAFTLDKLDEELPKLVDKADRIYYRLGIDSDFDDRIIALLKLFQRGRQRNGTGPNTLVDPADALHEMRLVKAEEELVSLRRAIEITGEGHLAAMRTLRPGMYEHEIEAVLRYEYLKHGSHRHGYPPIVAAGANATVLHHTTNRSQIVDGDLLLIDSGAEYGYYTADVTRTFPASGVFTEDQAAIYQLVLDAQIAAIDQVRPGATFKDPHDAAVRVLTEGMLRLGLLEGEFDKVIEEQGYNKFYMHRTSHWLGMDVHDVGRYKTGDEWTSLTPGMVLTIEPGFYIAEDAEGVDPRYLGLGIRIEDDVLVTEQGCEVLSSRIPKTIDEIEGLMMGAHMGE